MLSFTIISSVYLSLLEKEVLSSSFFKDFYYNKDDNKKTNFYKKNLLLFHYQNVVLLIDQELIYVINEISDELFILLKCFFTSCIKQ